MIVRFVVDSIVQGGIAVALACLVLAFVPVRNATTRYAVWFVVLLALVVAPGLSVARPWLHVFAGPPATHGGTFSLTALRALNGEAARWSIWTSSLGFVPNAAIAGIWIAGASAAFIRLAVSFVRIGRLRRHATAFSCIDGVRVLSSHLLTVPIATGILSPAIVLPDELARSLRPSELRCTLEHELAHVRRSDVATNAIQRIAEALLFWNPWVYLVGRRLCAEREAACDDVATVRVGENTDYAGALAALASRLVCAEAPLLTPSAFGSRGGLVARIERLTSAGTVISHVNYVAVGGCIVLLSLLALVGSSVAGAPAAAAVVPSRAAFVVAAASCKYPNADVKVILPVPPDLPKSQLPSHPVTALVRVTVAASGKATAADVYRSSGDPNVDRAVLTAAKKSTYAPKTVNCAPVESTYLFKATFGP